MGVYEGASELLGAVVGETDRVGAKEGDDEVLGVDVGKEDILGEDDGILVFFRHMIRTVFPVNVSVISSSVPPVPK